MPILAGLFLSIFTEIAAFFGKWFGKKLAWGSAAVASFGIMTVVLYGTLSLLMNGLNFALPNWPGVNLSIWFAIPPQVPVGIASLIAADSAIALYRWNVRNLQLMAYVT
jgi:hypothetical protein